MMLSAGNNVAELRLRPNGEILSAEPSMNRVRSG
jgi:hypothetical protein